MSFSYFAGKKFLGANSSMFKNEVVVIQRLPSHGIASLGTITDDIDIVCECHETHFPIRIFLLHLLDLAENSFLDRGQSLPRHRPGHIDAVHYGDIYSKAVGTELPGLFLFLIFGLRSSLNDVSNCLRFGFLLCVKAVKVIEVIAEFTIPDKLLAALCDLAEEI